MSDYAELLPRKKRRRWIIWLAVVFVLALLVVPRLTGRLLKSKLQWMVASHLNATLEIDRLDYIPPYRLVGHNLALVTKGGDGQSVKLVELKKVELLLAELPTGSGPLVIQRLDLVEPSVHLIRSGDEVLGGKGLAKPSPEIDASKPKPKLSEMFRLRHLTLGNGSITYQDRTGGASDSPAMTWKNLNVDMDTVPTSASGYTYKFTARNAPLAEIDANGNFDIDSLVIEVEKLALVARADAAKDENALPPQMQEILKRYRVGGEVRIDGSGRIAASEADHATFHAVVTLKDARGFAPQWNVTLDRLNMHIDCGREAASSPVTVKVIDFDALGRDLRLVLESGGVSWNPESGRWDLEKLQGHIDLDAAPHPAQGDQAAARPNKLQEMRLTGRVEFTGAGSGVATTDARKEEMLRGYELLAYVRNASMVPPTFSQPMEQISGGPIRLASDVVSIDNISALYGKDQWHLASARIPLRNLSEALQINEITGTALFDRSTPPYPKALEEIMAQLRPAGLFSFGGSVNIGKTGSYPQTLFNLNITTDDGSAIVTSRQVELSAIKADVQVERNQVRLRKLSADTLGGQITASGELKTSEKMRYVGSASVKDLDMEQVSKTFVRPSGEAREWKGRLSGKTSLEGEGKSTDGLRADGELEILEGDFWEVPMFKGILDHMKLGGATKVGQAAATFTIEERMVTLKKFAVSSPALGVQGTGKIDFDQKLNLDVVAAPLADWRDKLKKTGIPLVSNAAGEVFGGIQKVLNSATSTLLYQFKITGTTKDPKVEAVPVPVLTKNAGSLFAKMLTQKKDDRLLESVKEKDTEPRSKVTSPE